MREGKAKIEQRYLRIQMYRIQPEKLSQARLAFNAARSSRSSILFQESAVGSTSMSKTGRNAVVTSLMVCCGFVVCCTPSRIIYFINSLHQVIDWSGWLYHSSVVLLFTNSCINPFIYAAKYLEFQMAVKRMMRKQFHPESNNIT